MAQLKSIASIHRPRDITVERPSTRAEYIGSYLSENMIFIHIFIE